LAWRKAITASTTFCQLRSSIFELHIVNHGLAITLLLVGNCAIHAANFS
jgi:hypothetical protein